MSKAADLALLAGGADTSTDTSNTGNVALDFSQFQNFILTFTGNVTLTNPTTEVIGQSGFIICIQDGTGSRTLSLGTDYETAGANGITLSTAANSVDMIPYVVQSASNILLGSSTKGICIVALLGNLTGSSQFFNPNRFYNDIATQSLRFDDGSSAYLTRTPSSAGNRKTWTWSGWIKLGVITIDRTLFGAGTNGDNQTLFNLGDTDRFVFSNEISNTRFIIHTDAVFRDPSAWYHVVLAVDTTQGTDTNRVKLYVNGELQTFSSVLNGFPNQNVDTFVNAANANTIGYSSWASQYYNDGYMAEVNFVDGNAYDASYFGETKNGVWIPKKYTGSYGTNGFRLQFNQTGVGTASTTTIGADTSGNTNHYTSSGIVASDCAMPDSPENNFCTMNSVDLNYNAELLEGNLHIKATTYSGGNYGHAICTFNIPSSGKWYIEILGKNLAGSGNSSSFGIIDRNVIQPSSNKAQPNYVVTTDEGFDGLQHQHYVGSEYVAVKVDGATSGSNISISTSGNTGSVSALAIDVDNGYLYVGATDGVGGTGSQIRWLDYADGSTGTSNVNPESGSSGTGGIARTFTNNDVISVETTVSGDNSNKSQIYLNAGQDSSFGGTLTAQGNTDSNGIGDFYYVVPSGFLALCSANLPEPTISPNANTQADNYFNTVLYTGTGSSGQAITGVGFQPDWLWQKKRSGASSHNVFDSSRGVAKRLYINGTGAEDEPNQITSFDTDGFTINSANDSSATYVAWNWKANGGSTSSNSDGSITSTVQASTTSGFSIVTYTGNGSAITVGHGLGTTPDMFIVKRRNGTSGWATFHKDLTDATQYIQFNVTSGQSTGNNVWNQTDPTSTVFTVGTDLSVNTGTYVAYCFAEVEGYSKFGSYTGNGSADGTFVYTGFRPAWVMIKQSSASGNSWHIIDNKRIGYNERNDVLLADDTASEQTNYNVQERDLLSNGFKMRDSNAGTNANGSTFIYMAFAEAPFKYANAR